MSRFTFLFSSLHHTNRQKQTHMKFLLILQYSITLKGLHLFAVVVLISYVLFVLIALVRVIFSGNVNRKFFGMASLGIACKTCVSKTAYNDKFVSLLSMQFIMSQIVLRSAWLVWLILMTCKCWLYK